MAEPKDGASISAESIGLAAVEDLLEADTSRIEPATLDVEVARPAGGSTSAQLPAAVLVVDLDRRRGVLTAAKLMEHGYTCRVAGPDEALGALAAQRFDAALVEVPSEAGRRLDSTTWALVEVLGGAVVLSSAVPVEAAPARAITLLKPWLSDQVVRALEDARSRGGPAASGARAAPAEALSERPPRILDDPADDADLAAFVEPDRAGPDRAGPDRAEPDRAEPDRAEPRPRRAAPERRRGRIEGLPRVASIGAGGWEVFEARVVRARLADAAGEGFTPARIRRANLDGGLELESRRPLPVETEIRAELFLSDGRRADFDGRVESASPSASLVRLEVDAADVPFLYAWIAECAEAGVRSEPARIVPIGPAPRPAVAASAPQGSHPAGRPEPGRAPGSADLDALWAQASRDLDDDDAQQRFIEACLKAQALDLAVRRYRDLKRASPADPRAERYLVQVGTILGFYALKQAPTQVEEGRMSLGVKIALAVFVLAAAFLVVLVQLIG